jgi:hypothetical protein
MNQGGKHKLKYLANAPLQVKTERYSTVVKLQQGPLAKYKNPAN